MSERAPLSLFAGFGVELEYIIVDEESLSVRPDADRLLATLAGAPTSDFEAGDITLSNELVAHVIEFKTTEPAVALAGLEQRFHATVTHVNQVLASFGAQLMPTAAHPWMDPERETRLWPLDNGEVYRAFDRIFNCKGHGWSNLQSVHLNLPFANDEEFGRLHAAIRLILPLLPALAASSPIIEGQVQPALDTRLTYYRTNCARIPAVTGRVIPESVFSHADYRHAILEPLYRDIAPHDPEELLREEWLNARGAIARFSRNAIEIRVLDIQECPAADLAILRLVVAVLRALVAERWASYGEQKSWAVEPLESMFLDAVQDADQAVIADPNFLRTFGLDAASGCTMQALWRHLHESLRASGDLGEEPALHIILEQGPLARRIVRALGPEPRPTPSQLASVYGQICACLARNELFSP